MRIKLSLHATQREVWDCPKRFKVLVCGRRWGKTRFACEEAFVKALLAEKGDVFYVAPTATQAKDLTWRLFKQIANRYAEFGPFTFKEKDLEIHLPTGVRICLKGSDREDTLRGNSLVHCVIDEYQDMKPNVFSVVLRPALMDSGGTATIIGTPKGKNHHFWQFVEKRLNAPNWHYFHFTSYDNPKLPHSEINEMKAEMSSFYFQQEVMAEFKIMDSDLFQSSWIKVAKASDNAILRQATTYTAVDLAGYTDFAEAMKTVDPKSRLDEYSIASVGVFGKQWHVKDITTGRDTIARTAKTIVSTAQKHQAVCLGVEKGALFQAIYPTLRTEMQTLGTSMRLTDLTHANQGKIERILWALQGKMERGLITFEPGEYLAKFTDQLLALPTKGVHDDMPDSLSMINQLAPLGNYLDPRDMMSSWTDSLSTDDF